MVRRLMTYGKYLMYLEYIKYLPSAARVIATDWVNHALIGIMHVIWVFAVPAVARLRRSSPASSMRS
jgi:hypothetical protein